MATHGAFKDATSCMKGLAAAYPDKAQREKACRAVAGIRPTLEAAPRLEGVRVTGTTLPGGSDGHVHDFTAEAYEWRPLQGDDEPELRVSFWCSPAYVPGQLGATWEPGKPQAMTVTHWHEWNTTQRTAEAVGHSHDLPAMPDLIVGELKEAAREEDAPGQVARVEEGDGFWLVRGLIATRVGVNRRHRLRRRLEAVKQTVALLDGAAILYGHPRDGSVDVDRLTAPGVIVNARLEGDAAAYDALIWKANPPGYAVTDADLARNSIFADAARRGDAIHNSLGSLTLEAVRRGEADATDGSGPAEYDRDVQHVKSVGHVAILAPVIPVRGSCPPSTKGGAGCGLNGAKATPDAVAAALGVRREAVLQAAARAAHVKP